MKSLLIFIAALLFATLCMPVSAQNMQGNENSVVNTVSNISTPASNGFIVQPDANIVLNEKMVRAGILYDMDEKKIVWEKKMDVAFPVASLTKMMVALLTVEDIRSGKISWTDKVNVTKLQVAYVKGRRKTVTVLEQYSRPAER